MPNISMPNGDVVAFPDDMPRDQIKGMITNKFPDLSPKQDSGAMDALKSLGGGLERGAAAMPMIIPNLVNQMAAGPQLLGQGIKDTIMGNPTTKNPDIWQPFYSSEDALKMLPEKIQPYTPQSPSGVGADLIGQLGGGLAAGKGMQSLSPKVTNILENNTSGSQPKPEIPSASDVRSLASQAYKTADQQGAVLYPESTNKFIEKASAVLPQTEAGKIVSGETATTKLIDRLQLLRDKHLNLQSAQEIDSALGDAMTSEVDPLTGKMNAEGNKLLKIQTALRDTIDNASQNDLVGGSKGFDTWNQGRQLWSASAKMNDIERIMNRADMTDNPATAIKSGFRTLASNPSRLRGYTPEEISAIQRAAKTGVLTGTLKFLGSRLISSMSGAIAGAAGGGSVGAGLGMVGGAAVGTPMRNAAAALQANRGNSVLNAIANRPIVQKSMGITPPIQPSQPSLMAPASTMLLEGEGQLKPQGLLPAPQQNEGAPQNASPSPAISSFLTTPTGGGQVKPGLFDRVIKAESSGNQSAVSPKGAIGIAQIMPRTAPDAARAAGLPYDFNKLQNDPEYNAALGKAYLGKMMDKYGNEAHALIAYNWGPGNTDKWLRSGGKFERLPKETQAYLQKILG